MYADDTTVYCIGDNGDVAVSLLNRALTELYEWCLINRLTPHPIKCEAILMTRSNYIGPILPVSIGGSLITWVEKSRLLGVTVDNKLVRSEKELRKQAQLAKKIEISSRECIGKFLFKCYSAICHLQSGHLGKLQ